MEITREQAILIAVVVIAFFWANKQGYFTAEKDKGANKDPNETGAKTDGSEVSISDAEAQNKARSFRGAMLDNSYSGQIFQDACQSLLALSNADLQKVSNKYNTLFVNEQYNTLRSVLQQEYVFFEESQKLRKQLLSKFDEINI